MEPIRCLDLARETNGWLWRGTEVWNISLPVAVSWLLLFPNIFFRCFWGWFCWTHWQIGKSMDRGILKSEASSLVPPTRWAVVQDALPRTGDQNVASTPFRQWIPSYLGALCFFFSGNIDLQGMLEKPITHFPQCSFTYNEDTEVNKLLRSNSKLRERI